MLNKQEKQYLSLAMEMLEKYGVEPTIEHWKEYYRPAMKLLRGILRDEYNKKETPFGRKLNRWKRQDKEKEKEMKIIAETFERIKQRRNKKEEEQ